MKKNKMVIGTRGSKLALWQAEWVKAELERMHPGLSVSLQKIKTTGDKILDVPLAKVGGKGLFVKEIEEAMLRGEVDIAVHSMKDVPTEFPKGLHLAVICEREIPLDAFISPSSGRGFKYTTFQDLPKGAIVGTSSLRRSCQLLNIRPDLKIAQLRGNLETRFRKLNEGQFDAMILAAAGVKRLGWGDRITQVIPAEVSLPAIGQGAIGIECRIGDKTVNDMIAPLDHRETSICVRAERALLKKLEGGCQVPIAAHARLTADTIQIVGLVGEVDGSALIKSSISGPVNDFETLGIALAEDLLARGAKRILDEVYAKNVPPIDGKIAS
ncbi:MAG: hydroxymethylbilane synthase [bacterium]